MRFRFSNWLSGKNQKGFGVIVSILVFLVIFVGFYLILQLPVPTFKKLREIINFFLIVILWVGLQFGVFYGYYKIGNYGYRWLRNFNTHHKKITYRIKQILGLSKM